MLSDDSEKPPRHSFYLAFCSLRWRIVMGFRESGGCMSMVDPHVEDDINTIAWAPLSETSGPDMEKIHTASPWHEAHYVETHEKCSLVR